MRYIFLLLTIIFATLKGDDALFNQACTAYDQKQYKEAISIFNQILASGVESGEIYYNLGNAYYREQDVVNAIVNYERAAKLMGNDPDLMANLTIARQKIVDKIEVKPVLPIVAYMSDLRKSLNIYSLKSAIVISLFFVSLFLTLLFLVANPRLRKIFLVGISLSSFALLVISVGAYYSLKEYQVAKAVVAIEKSAIMASPDNNSNNTELFYLHKGATVQIHRSNADWIEVSIDQDKKGWIEKSKVVVI